LQCLRIIPCETAVAAFIAVLIPSVASYEPMNAAARRCEYFGERRHDLNAGIGGREAAIGEGISQVSLRRMDDHRTNIPADCRINQAMAS
jgi:hypothetical protein